MLVQDFATAPRRGASAHRGGGVAFVSLLTGAEGAPDNFDLMIVEMTEDYATPRHRHNFDQIRVMLEGYFEWAPGTPQPEGSLGYFAEGTFYTQKGIGPSRTLVLQVGGGSSQGYTSYNQLQTGIAGLQKAGSFHDGVYTRTLPGGGIENLDGYQAVWEHLNGRKLAYPAPRFQTPLIAFPDAFGWQALGEGAQQRCFGTFNERGTSAGQIAIAAGGSAKLEAGGQALLLYVARGAGTCGGARFGREDAIRLDLGETAEIAATADCLLFTFRLPVF
jgi:hypothetical protein